MPVKLKHVVDRTSLEGTLGNRFGRIVLFFDRNDHTEDDCLKLVREWIEEDNQIELSNLMLGEWLDARLKLANRSRDEYEVRILAIVLPPSSEGDLEVFLANSLRERSEDDKLLVDKSRFFIDEIPDEPYLNKRRYRSKACLGSILSVISPDWVFSELDRRLTQIKWKKIESVAAVYEKLGEL